MRIMIAAILLTTSTLAIAQPMPGYEVIEPSEKQMRQLQALTPQSVLESITIEDDELERIATITTENAWSSKGKFTDRVRSDNLLRAFVNKTTGNVIYQLYQSVSYNNEWRNFQTANYSTSQGLAAADLVTIDKEVVACYSMCSYREVVGFDLPTEVVEEIAAQYSPGNSPLWRYRLKGNGLDWEDRIAPAEAAGLLMAVEAYQNGRGGD